jgi:hypothetical protein
MTIGIFTVQTQLSSLLYMLLPYYRAKIPHAVDVS